VNVAAEDLARRAAELAERAAGPRPESWRPDLPELGHPNPIIGVLVRVKSGGDRGYGETKIAQLRALDGTVWDVWLLGQVLQEEWETQRPVAGELVAVYSDGRRQGASAEYRAYRVVVDRQTVEHTADRAERPAESDADALRADGEGFQSPGPGAPEARCPDCDYPAPEHADGCLPF
jgi:hypothetical protein